MALELAKVRHVLLDIEGTTTSISFVKDVLFPYVRRELHAHLLAQWGQPELEADIAAIRQQAAEDSNDDSHTVAMPGAGAPQQAVVEAVEHWVQGQMDRDRKIGALKQLQGHMWRAAYAAGHVRGHVYEDVPAALAQWRAAGRALSVYSSGSEEAQRLLFAHSDHGDLSAHFSHHFDTRIGAKTAAESYTRIADTLQLQPSSVLFFTDVVAEARAARLAGMQAAIVLRPGNAPLSAEEKSELPTVTCLGDVVLP